MIESTFTLFLLFIGGVGIILNIILDVQKTFANWRATKRLAQIEREYSALADEACNENPDEASDEPGWTSGLGPLPGVYSRPAPAIVIN